jgi:hypothetical protein
MHIKSPLELGIYEDVGTLEAIQSFDMKVRRGCGVAMGDHCFENSAEGLDRVKESSSATRVVRYFVQCNIQINVSACVYLMSGTEPSSDAFSTYPRPVSTESNVGPQRTLFTRETFATIGLLEWSD